MATTSTYRTTPPATHPRCDVDDATSRAVPPAKTLAAGVVIIGRNEGTRLQQCFSSVIHCGLPIVYVDSGSTDNSVALAHDLAIDTIELSASTQFSAARARNAGLAHLLYDHPHIEAVQFLDGDSTISENWLERARTFLTTRPEIAAVCGRIREQHRDASIYNQLCELEWHSPMGQVPYCGGIAMIRVDALKQVEGFNPTVIAAEDTELCIRLRLEGWKIWNLDTDMAFHDAAMTSPVQWWTRAMRAGHAFAQGASLHGQSPLRLFVRETRSAWFWGFILPALMLVLAWPTHGASMLLASGYLLLSCRIYASMRRKNHTKQDALLYAAHCVVAKFPQIIGQFKFHLNRIRGRHTAIIEHKKP